MKNIDWHAGFVAAMNDGICELIGNLPFRTQLVITGIPNKNTVWLSCLTKNGTSSELKSIIEKTSLLDGQHKKEADSVMDIFTSANSELVVKEMEDPDMCNAVNELFADKIKEMEAVVAQKDSLLADTYSLLADKDSLLADKDSVIKKLQAQIDELRAQLAEKN